MSNNVKRKRIFVQPPFNLERILIVLDAFGSSRLKRKQQLIELDDALRHWRKGSYEQMTPKDIVGSINGVLKSKEKMEAYFGGEHKELFGYRKFFVDGNEIKAKHKYTYTTDCRFGENNLVFGEDIDPKMGDVIATGIAPVVAHRHLAFDLFCLMERSEMVVKMESVANAWPHTIDEWGFVD